MKTLFYTAALSLLSLSAVAGGSTQPPTTVPEPSALALFAAAAAAVFVARKLKK